MIASLAIETSIPPQQWLDVIEHHPALWDATLEYLADRAHEQWVQSRKS